MRDVRHRKETATTLHEVGASAPDDKIHDIREMNEGYTILKDERFSAIFT